MGLNPEQTKIVESISGTVNVAAGAGTGKTFTLTQRIVSCVKRMLDNDLSDTAPMRRILAITFTTKAAEELRSRVRAALIQEAVIAGDDRLAACALDVDNAWISTIHGMASRILKENALDFGIDFSFQLLSNDESDAIFENALNVVLEKARSDNDKLVQELLYLIPIYSAGFNSQCVVSMINEIINHAEYMPNGFDGICYIEPKESPRSLIKELMNAGEELLPLLGLEGYSASDAGKCATYIEEMNTALEGAERAICDGFVDDFMSESFDVKAFLDIILAFPTTTNKFPSKPKEFKEDYSKYRYIYKNVLNKAMLSVGSRRIKALVSLAKQVYQLTESIKHGEQNLMSQSDLLRVCNMHLSDPKNESILKKYQDQFAFIMVDEFQDTNSLQMNIIEKLARKDGNPGHAGLANVCTVGDMQQAIYRFRGGDVTLARQRASELSGYPNTQYKLSSNYRSHKDILDAVEMVFSQREVFGDEFLKLEACASKLDGSIEKGFKKQPRVVYDFLHYSKKRNISIELARSISALRIAKRFKSLIDAGVPARKMAILLGKTSEADVYSKALAEFGIESIVIKGSVFSKTEEAQLVKDILKFATNIDEEESLFRILTSRLFNVRDDDLLLLATDVDSDSFCRRRFSGGFSLLMNCVQKDVGDLQTDEKNYVSQFSDGMIKAASVLAEFIDSVRSRSVSDSLRHMLLKSGLLYRLEKTKDITGSLDASAISAGANFNKAINMISEFEKSSSGVAQLALKFENYLATEKLTPGVLATSDSNFVQIITVHSSKGLEFDHVAVADMKDGISKTSRYIVENYGDKTYISMKASDNEFSNDQLKKKAGSLQKFTFEDDKDESNIDVLQAYQTGDAVYFYETLDRYSKLQDFEEARRLLYVAMTRAKETLIVSHINNSELDKPFSGIFNDVSQSLIKHFSLSEDMFDKECHMVQMPIEFNREKLDLASIDDVDLKLASKISGVTIDVESSADSADSEFCMNAEDGEFCANTADEEFCANTASEEFLIPIYESKSAFDYKNFSFGREGLYSYSLLSASISQDDSSIDVHEANGFMDGGSVAVDARNCVKGCGQNVCSPSEGFIFGENESQVSDLDKATDLGTAFHRLAQMAIISASEADGKDVDRQDLKHHVRKPSEELIKSQIKSCGLSDTQIVRLNQAIDLWFNSNECRTFADNARIFAEVPFSVQILNGEVEFILEGEIDGLAIKDDDECLFIDYKTGGASSETYDQICKKHLLQAQCYAYSLMRDGFKKVEAHFIRVEHKDEQDNNEPEVVKYLFKYDDIDALRDAIIDAYIYAKDQDE